MIKELGLTIGRRELLGVAGGLASLPILGLSAYHASAQTTGTGAGSLSTARTDGRRMLGKLEVSSLGLGVQNMHRTYQTTIPYRPEMINIIRTAFDRGVTFFDCAEAYGPGHVPGRGVAGRLARRSDRRESGAGGPTGGHRGDLG